MPHATAGSAGSAPAATMAASDGTVMRHLMGQDALDRPLLPQPGDIWAGVLPPAQSGPAAVAPVGIRGGRPAVDAAEPAAGQSHRKQGAIAATGPAYRTEAATPATGPAHRTEAATAATGPAHRTDQPSRTGQPSRTTQTVAATGQPHPAAVGIATTGRLHAAAPVIAAASTGILRPAPAVARATHEPMRPVAAAKAGPPAVPRLMVQLAAADSAQSAEAEWRRLRQHAPTLTDGHKPAVIEAKVNGQHVWRLRAAGFADLAEAGAFCSGIRAVQANCWVVPPSASP